MLNPNQPCVVICKYRNHAIARAAHEPASFHASRHLRCHTSTKKAAAGALTNVYFTKIASTQGKAASHRRSWDTRKTRMPASVNATPKKSTRNTGIHDVTTATQRYAAQNNNDGVQLRVTSPMIAATRRAQANAAHHTATRAALKCTP